MGIRCALACLLVASGGSAWAQTSRTKDDVSRIGRRDVGKGVNFYSIEKEIALGRQLSQEVHRQAKVLDDPIVSEFVNRLGQNLVRNSDAIVPFTFEVLEGDTPNAFSLPGGYVFVYSGLIKLASEEDELAAAMAHEIAHVNARHMTRQETKRRIANIASTPVLIAAGGGLGGVVSRHALNAAMPAAFMHFSRVDEEDADYLGTQYLYAAGYDPNGAITIFEKLESLARRQTGTVARILADHPREAQRILKTEEEIGHILPARGEYVVTTSEYSGIRQRLIDRDPKRAPEDRPRLRTREDNPAGPADERPTIRRRELGE
jgi:beta-barrel assembly-enhancing protease